MSQNYNPFKYFYNTNENGIKNSYEIVSMLNVKVVNVLKF